MAWVSGLPAIVQRCIAMPPSTIRDLLNTAAARLALLSPTARLDAELLLAHGLGWSRAKLIAEAANVPTADQAATFAKMIERRANLEPVAYLTGARGFYGLDFAVDPRVLVPRPETELLVELAIAAARRRGTGDGGRGTIENSPVLRLLTIADIGTGSGAIAVALAANLPDAQIFAVDLDRGALAVAAHNIASYDLSARVSLLQGDLLAPLPAPVDLLVSNPPYTILAEIDPGVYRHEPHLALDGGPGGMAVYERLIAAAPTYLRPGGALLLEIGAWQAVAVTDLITTHLPAATVSLHQDFAGHDRVVIADLHQQ